MEAWLAEKKQELDFKLKQLAFRARSGKLQGVRLVDGVLIVSPHRTEVPKAVEAVKWLCLDRMPRIDITDLLAEVNTLTGFAGWFTHLRTGDVVRVTPALLAAILGDATNLGAKRMADGSAGLSERQITWARLFHIRPETYNAALAAIINAHLKHPHTKLWGTGTTYSSDGQFFHAAGRGARRSDVNAHYSSDPGAKFYTSVSDQHASPKACVPKVMNYRECQRSGSANARKNRNKQATKSRPHRTVAGAGGHTLGQPAIETLPTLAITPLFPTNRRLDELPCFTLRC